MQHSPFVNLNKIFHLSSTPQYALWFSTNTDYMHTADIINLNHFYSAQNVCIPSWTEIEMSEGTDNSE